MRYVLRKVEDNVFNGNHPNGILEGMSWKGHIYKKPTVGERFKLGTIDDHPRNHLLTSTVIEIVDEHVFKTRNSTYMLKKERL